ncbi:hypothetical protein MQH03_23590 (plasmid) [Enterobacter cloacae]|uniref:hypothetical protein n=1 Tax=Enterobacter cloacae TaxID=550 RepID=UPI00200D64FA|nr:hypothetical protein [Enterobacter cloacae]UPW34357.1 hypothetical protein MQH03_23590 [Enterobacter cloacae]
MHNHEIQTIAIFSAQYKNIEDAENAGALYSVDIEYPMTLNDLSRLCDSIAEAVGVPGCHERCNSDPHPTPEIRSRG